MGVEKDREYYDKGFTTQEHYSVGVSWDKTPWADLYKRTAELLTKHESILEVGCGTGQFAEMLIKCGYNYSMGFDFSSVAIRTSYVRCNVMRFFCIDIKDFDFVNMAENTVIALEVLEHINDDLLMIARIPRGRRVIFSVPDFDSEQHVRHFSDEKAVTDRYKGYFSEYKVETIGNIFLVDATR